MSNSTFDRSDPLVEPLTHREREILARLAGDLCSREIAEALTLAPSSIKWYTRQIYAKLGVNCRQEAIRRARELGLLDLKTTAVFHSHTLPASLTPFVGRQNELQQIGQMLADPSYRLVTLTGAGGVGKTRLALRVANELQGNYPQGAWLVELASLSEPELVPQSVAAVFYLRPERERPILSVLMDYLRNRKLLLVLDNCEHLVAASASLASSLLQACPDLRILATSREALGIEGESTYLVPSLSFPEEGEKKPPKELVKYEAVELFTRRAKAVFPGFELSGDNANAVAQICQHLDGIPLALELVAARLRVMDVEQITSQLEDRFHLLSGGDRSALPRLQTMRASIDWSYQLLPDAERKLLRRLSVFAGGWSLAAAKAVCADDVLLEADILDLLGGLVNKSLVLVIRRRGQEMRYRMLETIHHYAYEKLSESGEAESIRHQHLAYFLTLAERAEPEVQGAEQQEWFDRLEAEHDNLRAALSWSLEGGERCAEAGLRMAGSLWWFWSMHGYNNEGGEWLERTLTLTPSQASADPVTRAKALSKLGWLKFFDDAHNEVRAEASAEEGLALGRTLGPVGRESMALALWAMGAWAFYQADYARAKLLEEESLKLFRELGHRWGICESLTWSGMALVYQGNHQQAAPLLEESLRLARQAQDSNEIAFALWQLGGAAVAREDYEQAKTLLEESLVLFKEIKDYQAILWLFGALGNTNLHKGDYQQAASNYKEALALSWERGDERRIAEGLEQLANTAAVQKQPEQAARLLGAAEALRKSSGAALHPYQRAEYERCLVALRPQLDEVALATLWAKGRGMTLEEAIAFALNEKEE